MGASCNMLIHTILVRNYMWVIGWQMDGDLRPTVFCSLAFVVQLSQISHVVCTHYFLMLFASVNCFLRVRRVSQPLCFKTQGIRAQICTVTGAIHFSWAQFVCTVSSGQYCQYASMQHFLHAGELRKNGNVFLKILVQCMGLKDIGFLLQSHSLVIRLICGSKISQPVLVF
jgi:hypothetical protein